MHTLFRFKTFLIAAAFVAALSLNAFEAYAQLPDDLVANIPFQFNVENTKLPAGEYNIRPAEEWENVIELENANKDVSVFVMPENSQSTQLPKTSELTFDKIGNKYFLRDITIQDSNIAYTFPQSKYEAKLAKANAKLEKHKITITHHKAKARKS